MALSLKAFGKMADFFPIKVIRGPVGFMFEAINFSQKPSPSPAVRDVPPAIWRPNAIKPDQLLSNAQRAPEVFQCWQSAEATTAGARCGDVG